MESTKQARPSRAARPRPQAAREPRVLLVDSNTDEGATAALRMLRQSGLVIEQAVGDIDALLEQAGRYSLVILDIHTERGDGLELCRRLLDAAGPPVVVWSARASPLDRIAALELGAEDVVCKRTHPLELLARIRAVLRRGGAPFPRAWRDPGVRTWTFDVQGQSLCSWRDNRVLLGPGAAALLRLMCERPRQRLTREDLGAARGSPAVNLAPRTLDVAVSRMRRAMARCDHADELLKTVRLGYLFDAEVDLTDSGFVMAR
jgi:two-component system OmpR family response regulator